MIRQRHLATIFLTERRVDSVDITTDVLTMRLCYDEQLTAAAAAAAGVLRLTFLSTSIVTPAYPGYLYRATISAFSAIPPPPILSYLHTPSRPTYASYMN